MSLSTHSLAALTDAHKHHGCIYALRGIGITLEAGRVVALLGPNGAGKSTAVSLLLGLATPESGTARVLGSTPVLRATRRGIGVMLQSATLPAGNTVRECLQLVASAYPNPLHMDDCAQQAGIADLLQRRCNALSGGQQRRVQFAMAIIGQPRVLFLDEPSTGLDIDARQSLWAAIRERARAGCAVLLTTHYLEEAEALADDVLVMEDGRVIAAGTVDELRAQQSGVRIRVESELDPASALGSPGVRSATREGTRLVIHADSSDAVIAQLLRRGALHHLEVQRPRSPMPSLGSPGTELPHEPAEHAVTAFGLAELPA